MTPVEGSRVAEHVVRRFLRPPQRLRVDLHGVSVFGPRAHHLAMRWEWIERISVDGGVVVTGGGKAIVLPPGAFGLDPESLAQCLRDADDISSRTEVIGRLNASGAPAR